MKIIQILVIVVLSLLVSTFSMAQNDIGKMNDLGRIALNPYVPEMDEALPSGTRVNLENKLGQIATRYGMGASELMPRFIISANVVLQSKEVTSTAPPMVAMVNDVTLYIGDGFEGKIFASTNVSVKGVGDNETKAYSAALKGLNPSNKEIERFMEEGKRKIIAYYNSRCDFIIKEAQTLEKQNRFDEAIYLLMGIPDVCAECYNKALDATGPIFQSKIDWECKDKMSKAKSVWSAGLNYAAANDAASILMTIDPEASCFKEVTPFANEIAKRVKEIDGREWDFKLQKEIGLERDRIKAYRDVGVAYGTNQPRNITYKSLW